MHRLLPAFLGTLVEVVFFWLKPPMICGLNLWAAAGKSAVGVLNISIPNKNRLRAHPESWEERGSMEFVQEIPSGMAGGSKMLKGGTTSQEGEDVKCEASLGCLEFLKKNYSL